MPNRKVYVANKQGHNYEAARAFGELVFVTEGQLSRYHTANILRAWVAALADSAPDDYLLLTSLNVICSIGAALFAHKHGRLNLLLFKQGQYLPREMVL